MNLKKDITMIRRTCIIIGALLLAALIPAVSQDKAGRSSTKADKEARPLVTFVELGSVKCIPCRMMQPIMASVEKKYGPQVKIVFHDVWTPTGKPFWAKYGIRLIPTQVFLDAAGKEFFRHEGFFPEAEIDKLLQKQGLKVRQAG